MNSLSLHPLGDGKDLQYKDVYYGSPALSATVSVVSEYIKYNPCPPDHMPTFLLEMHKAIFRALSSENIDQPAVSIEDSIEDEYLTCLEDGKKVKSLNRYLKGHLNMTPEEYREKWGLPDDYPMVAPALSRKRAAIARSVQPHKSKKDTR